ncbi:hypothetical protein Tco_0813110 [Tanacetum coccineum]
MIRTRPVKEKKRKAHETTEAWMNTPITFPLVSTQDVTEESLIIEAEVERCVFRRVYVDKQASVEVMFEHYFENLSPTIKARLRDTKTDLGYTLYNPLNDEVSHSKGWSVIILKCHWLEKKQMIKEKPIEEEKENEGNTKEVSVTEEMSTENGVNPLAPNPAHNSNFSLLSVLESERLTGPNYMDWMRNLRFTLRYEKKEYVLDEQIPTIDDDSTQEEIEAHQKHYDDANKAKASKECLDVVKSLMACKSKPGASICAFVLEIKGYFDILESLNMVFYVEISINIILSGLPADYNQFVLSYQMNGKETSIMELHSLLQTAEQGIKKIDVPSTSAAPVLTDGHNAKKRKSSHSNWKGKAAKGKSDRGSKRKAESEIAPTSDPKEAACFYCNRKGQ